MCLVLYTKSKNGLIYTFSEDGIKCMRCDVRVRGIVVCGNLTRYRWPHSIGSFLSEKIHINPLSRTGSHPELQLISSYCRRSIDHVMIFVILFVCGISHKCLDSVGFPLIEGRNGPGLRELLRAFTQPGARLTSQLSLAFVSEPRVASERLPLPNARSLRFPLRPFLPSFLPSLQQEPLGNLKFDNVWVFVQLILRPM